jgi:hypothetical protein
MSTRQKLIEKLEEEYFHSSYRFFPDNMSPDILAVPIYSDKAVTRTKNGYLVEIIRLSYFFVEDLNLEEIEKLIGPPPKKLAAIAE